MWFRTATWHGLSRPHLRHSNENGGRYLYLTKYYCGYGQKPHSIWMGKIARSVACRNSQTAIWICLKRQLSVTSGGTDANVCVPVCRLAETSPPFKREWRAVLVFDTILLRVRTKAALHLDGQKCPLGSLQKFTDCYLDLPQAAAERDIRGH